MFCCIHVVILLTFLHTSDQGLNKVCVLGSAQREFDIGLVNSCNWGNLSRDAPIMKAISKIPWIQSVQVNWFLEERNLYILMLICLPWHTNTTLSIINLTKSNCWKRQCWQDLKNDIIKCGNRIGDGTDKYSFSIFQSTLKFI
jgi:hypothetical protein